MDVVAPILVLATISVPVDFFNDLMASLQQHLESFLLVNILIMSVSAPASKVLVTNVLSYMGNPWWFSLVLINRSLQQTAPTDCTKYPPFRWKQVWWYIWKASWDFYIENGNCRRRKSSFKGKCDRQSCCTPFGAVKRCGSFQQNRENRKYSESCWRPFGVKKKQDIGYIKQFCR